MIFVKDFASDIFKDIPGTYYCSMYHALIRKPRMIMEVPSSWKNLDDYLSALKSKYRIRANKALEKAGQLERIELNEEQIQIWNRNFMRCIEKLSVMLVSIFLFFPRFIFLRLKKSMGDKFKMWIYLDQGELISFFTVIEDGQILDAHFLGMIPR
jgi:hypothetical protein